MLSEHIFGEGEGEEEEEEEEGEEEEGGEEEASVPVEFRCPITQMVMKKPVVATDGHSYELKAMQKWLLKKQTSPVTGKPLVSTNLILNQNLKKLIRDATSAPKRLGHPCVGRATQRQQYNLRTFFTKGKHPQTGADLDGQRQRVFRV